MSTSALSFSEREFDAPASRTFDIRWSSADVADVVVGTLPGQSAPDWLTVSAAGTSSPVTITVGILENRLSPGDYSTTLRVAASNSAGAALGTRDVTIDYTVTERPTIAVTQGNDLEFFAVVNGPLPDAKTVSLSGDDIPWGVTESDTWLAPRGSQGTAPQDTGITVSTGVTGPGTYTGTVTYFDQKDVDNRRADVNVTATFQDELAFEGAAENLSYRVAQGSGPSDTTFYALRGTDVNFTASATESWVVLDRTSGATTDGIRVGIDPQGLDVGAYSATVTLSDADTRFDQSISIDVELLVEPRRLTVERRGVAFVSTPSVTRLAATVPVVDSADANAQWTARSDSAWLSVTASGSTPGDLVLSADPTALPSETVSYATVTVTPDDADVRAPRDIRVGLWVSATDPVARVEENLMATHIVSDPVAPFVYVHGGGSDVDVFNVHTGAKARTLTNVVASAADMVVGGDGLTLYVRDAVNGTIVPVDLITDTAGTSISATSVARFAQGIVDGKSLIFTDTNTVIDVDTGAILTDQFDDNFFGPISGDANTVLSANGETLCIMNAGISPASLACYAPFYSYVDVDEPAGTELLSLNDHGSGLASNGIDAAINDAGTRFATASGGEYAFIVFDPNDLSTASQRFDVDPFTGNVEFDADGNLVGNTSSFSGTDTFKYDPTGRTIATLDIANGNVARRQMSVSGDTRRIAAIDESGRLLIVTVD